MFVLLSFTVYGRLIAIELRDGTDYRAAAAEPIVRKHTVAGIRGRILARDGTVLAYDQPVVSLAVQYRWLEEPVNALWLRRTARARLTAAERRDKQQVARAQQQVLDERRQLARRLMALCSLSEAQWEARAARVQRRVESIAAGVNARHEALDERMRRAASARDVVDPAAPDLPELIGRSIQEALFALDDPPPAPSITVAEELSTHVMHEGLSLEAVAEIQSHPELYPGVELKQAYRRAYPGGDLAAHVLGYLGVVNEHELAPDAEADAAKDPSDRGDYHPDDWVGRAGVERQYESLIRARRGSIEEYLDARGNVKRSVTVRQPASGSDVVLTLDPVLQRSAQALLDQALDRRLPSGDAQLDRASGGAVIVLDVRSGAVLAAAAAPRFDPNAFVRKDAAAVESWLNDPARPLFDRAVQMAIPPGSVFKIVSAAAIVAAGIDPRAPVECRGYLHQPEALRCEVYRRWGVGHGPVTMVDALARSCNVYFFHYAEQLGPDGLVDWARRFALAQPTGIDLPAEADGNLTAEAGQDMSAAEAAAHSTAEARLIAIGQGPVTATPLQIARVVAAVANGGTLVTPHVAERAIPPSDDPTRSRSARSAELTSDLIPIASARPVAGLADGTLTAIRKGLRQVVADEQGTGHDTVALDGVSIAGKTGSAETGGGRPAHSWFAGYAPSDQPQVAFVVVLEHAGSGSIAAGPVAHHLVERMSQLGYFDRAAGVARN